MSDAYQTPAEPLRALAEELARAGLHDVVICPGSRSTPLALALRMSSDLRCWVHLDERAGAFFALGMARAARRPVAILVTSGTAAAELTPAIVEARYGRLPVIALTADRPPELRERGAPQTIDQDHLYGRFAKWYAELPVPAPGDVASDLVRSVVGRALAVASAAPAGPVQLDLPFREPLLPEGSLRPRAASAQQAHTRSVSAQRALPEADLAALTGLLAGSRHGVIVCGPQDREDFGAALAGLAAASGFPILADGLSNLRFGDHDRSHVISTADVLLRSSTFAGRRRPDLVLRFGGTPTSKALLGWLARTAARQVVVDEGGWTEPSLLPVDMVDAEPLWLATALAERLESTGPDDDWLGAWRAADRAAGAALRIWLDSLEESFEGEIFDQLGRALPAGSILLAGNSMPVRDLDAFSGSGPVAIRCLGNRGANGIDGLLSTALGMAAVAEGPLVAVVGDVAFIHDLNALVAAQRLGISALIVLVNNDGGGIFSFLPQASAGRSEIGLPEHFEELFGSSHGLRFEPLVGALGAKHQVVATRDLASVVADSVGRPGMQVLEVRTERARNVELHRAALAAACDAVEGLM